MKCGGNNCPIKEKCLRFTSPKFNDLGYFDFPPFSIVNSHVICAEFLKNKPVG